MNESIKQASSRRPYGGRKILGVHLSMEILSKIASSPARRRRAFSSENDGFLCVKKGDIPGEIGLCRTTPPHRGGGVYSPLPVRPFICLLCKLCLLYVSYECYVEDARNGI